MVGGDVANPVFPCESFKGGDGVYVPVKWGVEVNLLEEYFPLSPGVISGGGAA